MDLTFKTIAGRTPFLVLGSRNVSLDYSSPNVRRIFLTKLVGGLSSLLDILSL